MTRINRNAMGQLIRKLRVDNGLTEQQLGLGMGVTKAAVSQWESGNNVGTESIASLARFFNITVDELVSGKLNIEENDVFFKRLYNLESYDFEGDINDGNIDKLKIFYEHCLAVKRQYFKMIADWASGKLNGDKLSEFEFIKKYFSLDSKYLYYLETGDALLPGEEQKQINVICEKYKGYKEDDYIWEMSKLYSLKYNLKEEAVVKSGNLEALSLLLSVMDQPQKDALLHANLHREYEEEEDVDYGFGEHKVKSKKIKHWDTNEIEQIGYLKVMLNSGCNVFRTFTRSAPWQGEEEYKSLEGRIEEIEERPEEDLSNIHLFMNAGGQCDLYALRSWKKLTRSEYLEFVDREKTDFYKSVVNDKEQNPLNYYYKLVETKGQFVKGKE